MKIGLRIILVLIILSVFPAGRAFAYSIDTHAYLTSVIFDFYNKNFSASKLPEGLRNFLVDGARREDDTPRWMNHFYDPVHNQGLTDSTLGTWMKSKDWAQTGTEQNKLKYKVPAAIASILKAVEEKKISTLTTESDFEWRQAIQYYIWGEKEQAVFVLGHILHLMEDASVPDHTRNDPHPGDSPYENWTDRFTLASPDSDLLSRLKNKTAVSASDLNHYFDGLANYSNKNFYSKDSIGIGDGFNLPEPIDYEKEGLFLFALNRDEEGSFPLFKQGAETSLVIKNRDEIIFNAPEIMSAYWSRLSTKAVQYTAGVIDLFLKEVEKAKTDPSYSKTKPKSALAELYDSAKGAVNGAWVATGGFFIESLKTKLAELMVGNNTASPVFAVPLAKIVSGIAILTSSTDADVTQTEALQQELALLLRQLESLRQNSNNYDVLLAGNEPPDSMVEKILSTSTTKTTSTPPVIPPPPAHQITYGGGGVFSSPNPETLSVIPPVTIPPAPPSAAKNFNASYSSSTADIIFNWEKFVDDDATTTVEYEIRETSSSDSVVWRGTDTSFRKRINEIGRDYTFTIQGFRNGEIYLASSKATVHVPSFLSALYFFQENATSARQLEIRYDSYPFVPDLYWHTPNTTYKIVMFYLNSEPPEGDEFVNLMQGFEPSDRSHLLTLNFKRCYNSYTPGDIVIFPDPGGVCGYGGPYTGAVSGDEREDNRVLLSIVLPDKTFTPDDYVTVAFYAFLDSGPASAFQRVAVDKTHYHFQTSKPPYRTPAPPSDLQFMFNEFHSVLDVSWSVATDPDSRDENLTYEFNHTTSSVFDVAEWKPTRSSWDRNVSVPVEPGNTYHAGVRAIDEHGNISEPIVRDWNYPDGFVPLPHQRAHGTDIGRFGYGQKILMPRDANINGVTFWIGVMLNYMTFSVTYADIYSDRDGAPGDLLVSSEPIRKTWVTSGTEVAHMEDAESIYEFSTSTLLRAGEAYWIIPRIGAGNQAGLHVLGSVDNPYADGIWGDDLTKDAYFFLRETE
ncbi:MAG: hypothetical protein AAB631_01185 [Patescibacteria group bacterium]